MQPIKYLTKLLFVLLASFFGCVEPFEFEKSIISNGVIVATGLIATDSSIQKITISRSVSLESPEFEGIDNCIVHVVDENGNTYQFDNAGSGIYKTITSNPQWEIGKSYKMQFITPDGKTYESDYEKMNPCPEIDSLYFDRKDLGTVNPDIPIPGVEVYLDFSASDDFERYYRYIFQETYEFYAQIREPMVLLNGQINGLSPSQFRTQCWITSDIWDIVPMTTKNLTENKYEKLPLLFVSNQSQRLKHKYSLLVKQLSISQNAYFFWEEQKKLLKGSGGLFETQPPVIQGNICCIDNPEEKVLGYFGASSVTTKRITIEQGTITEFNIEPYCKTPQIRPKDFYEWVPDVPVYVVPIVCGFCVPWGVLSRDCFDCRSIEHASDKRPDFW